MISGTTFPTVRKQNEQGGMINEATPRTAGGQKCSKCSTDSRRKFIHYPRAEVRQRDDSKERS